MLGRSDRSIAPVAHDVENLLIFFRNRLLDEECPSDVVIDRVWQAPLGPHIHEQKIAFLHGQIVVNIGRIMRIGAMRIDRDDRWMARREIPAIEFPQDEILNVELRHRNIFADTASDFLRNHVNDFTHVFRRIQVRFELLIGPYRFEGLDQIRRRNHFHSETPHEFDRSRIDT